MPATQADSTLPHPPTSPSPLGKKVVRLYVITMAASLLVLGIYLQQSWRGLEEKTLSDLQKDARITSHLLHDSLKDAGRLVAITKGRIEKLPGGDVLDPRKVHEALKQGVGDFSVYDDTRSIPILVYQDKGGRVVAQSNTYPTETINLSDRNYFRILKENPSLTFSIGNLVRSRISGRTVNHIAFPVRDVTGDLTGVISQQIDEKEIEGVLEAICHAPHIKITTLKPDSETVFHYPIPEDPERHDTTMGAGLLRRINILGKDSGVVRIARGEAGLKESVYAGYQRDTRDGLCTIATVLGSDVIRDFISEHRIELSITVVIGLLISVLFLGLCRQSNKTFSALFASRHDQLTGLGNRLDAEEACTRLWGDSRRSMQQISVLFMDIDHFKDFNDNYGHDVGDEVLHAVAECIRSCTRRPLDYCFRWGGEEFVAVLSETGSRAALHLAELIRSCVSKITITKDGVIVPPVTLSIGIATSLLAGRENQQRLFARADKALLRAKKSGRDRVVSE